MWWTFFSRAPRADRWGGLALIVAALTATWALADVSMSTGAMGMLVPMLGLPIAGLAWSHGRSRARGLADGPRRAAMAATIAAACGLLLLVRTGGMTSSVIGAEFHWRWTPTAEERLLAAAPPLPPAAAPIAAPHLPATPAPVAAAADVPVIGPRRADGSDKAGAARSDAPAESADRVAGISRTDA